MESVTISRELAHRCGQALVEVYNEMAKRGVSDSVLILSHRSLYSDLKKLGQEFLIASAIKPANPRNLPIF